MIFFNAARAEYLIHLSLAMRDLNDALRVDGTARVWAIGHLRRARYLRTRLCADVSMFPDGGVR